MTQRNVLPIASIPCGRYNGPQNCHISRRSREPPAYQPIELPSYKAAPLQAFGPLNPQRVCNHARPSSRPGREWAALPGSAHIGLASEAALQGVATNHQSPFTFPPPPFPSQNEKGSFQFETMMWARSRVRLRRPRRDIVNGCVAQFVHCDCGIHEPYPRSTVRS